ncbi:MAG: excinuclease ABC subunit UvrC [Candidatus Gastranaerophilales bacterium]|nr:excinuclease ABC subunit UvrC [Candidatus Gastranaerophilales bacterium]
MKKDINPNVLNQVKLMPKLPGSYQFYDKEGNCIYVGKAKNLFNRVRSYFISNDSIKVNVMVPKIARIECIVVDNEVEALILESELIKKYMPRYNILLKDDKKFPYFVITDEEYPRLCVIRKANRNPVKGKYFGPYTDSRAMRATLEVIQKIFPLKKCVHPKFNSRPCLYYDMAQCTAPCQKLITPENYKKILKDAELFLTGRRGELLKLLKNKMEEAANNLDFERALSYRNSIADIQKTMEKQKIVSEKTSLNNDYIGVISENNIFCAAVLEIREGCLVNKKDFDFKGVSTEIKSDFKEIIKAVMREYYSIVEDENIPSKIILSDLPEDKNVYEMWLSKKKNKPVKIVQAKNEKDKEILELANKNAAFNLEQLKIKNLQEIQNDYNEVGAYIKEKLSLTKFPHLVECYDISHTQGTNTTASRVVFENGIPKKNLYRKYKLKTIKKGEVNDFKSMNEILTRRFKRIKSKQDYTPDLIIIDGGKGQLSSALCAMDAFELKIDMVSLAKKEEEVFLPNNSKSVIFPQNSGALHFFQQIRDEAHRFAITFHRKLRDKNMLE